MYSSLFTFTLASLCITLFCSSPWVTVSALSIPSENSIRSTITRRGFVYSYYYKAPHDRQPTILFLHGFPSTHHDWDSQLSYFSNKGYGVIAPDLLGYGGTSAPDDVNDYKLLDIAEDVYDILNDLKVEKVIGVAHDWGTVPFARLLNTHIDRFSGAAFLAVEYIPPQPNFNYTEQIAELHQLVGYDVYGYMQFFAEDDAAGLTEKHLDSFYSLFFPSDPLVWKTDLAPLGKAKQWIEENRLLPRAHYWTAEQLKEHQQRLLQKGLKGPYNWYKGWVNGLNDAEDATIPLSAYNLSIPVFYGGALQDYVNLVNLTEPSMAEVCSNLVIKNFNTSHWIMLEAPNELNEALNQFFDSFE